MTMFSPNINTIRAAQFPGRIEKLGTGLEPMVVEQVERMSKLDGHRGMAGISPEMPSVTQPNRLDEHATTLPVFL
jgi:ABC-type uncharacterized transport system ATPase component